MKSNEKGITRQSEYYLYTPSRIARELLFYPTIIGKFEYEPGYYIQRNHFDSFLIMLIEEGTCEVLLSGKKHLAGRGSLVLLDCYNEHGYGSPSSWKNIWVHFDGPMARAYYENITALFGNVIVTGSYPSIHYELNSLYLEFAKETSVEETRASLHLTAMLNAILSGEKNSQSYNRNGIKRAIAYINEHFARPNRLNDLAELASLSPWYFTRLFKEETGLTPHQYLLETRISAAKYLLSTTSLTVREIAYRTGFPDESSFCASFKKREHMTPVSYKNTLSQSV